MQLRSLLSPLAELLRLPSSEKKIAFLLTAYFFFSLSSVGLVKSLQNGLYLGNLGFDWRLPTIYLALAVLSGPVVLLYRYLARRYSLALIASATLFTLALLLAAFVLFRNQTGPWIYPAFYIWAAIFSVLVPTQGWIFSYHLFTPRVAKRAFVVLGTGGILGGVFGGYYTAVFASQLGSTFLILHVFALVAVLELILVYVFLLRRRERRLRPPQEEEQASDRPRLVRTVFRSRHLTFLAALILLTGLVSTLVDLQFKWVLDNRYPNSEEEITQFFGGLLGTTFLLSALIQLLGTGQILRRFGLGVGLVILPAGLAAASLGMIAFANFWSVVVARATDGSLRSSVEQTSVELLYVPISDRKSIPVKSFMELVVLRLGDGIGAGLFLLVGTLVSFSIPVIAAVVGFMTLLWALVTREITEEYAQMLRRSLEYVGSKAVRRAFEIDEAVADNTLITALESENPDNVYFALQQLQMYAAESDLSQMGDFSGEVISMDVSGFYKMGNPAPRWLRSVERLVDSPDPRIAAVALHLMLVQEDPRFESLLKNTLRSEKVPGKRFLAYLEGYSGDPGRWLDRNYALKWCEQAGPQQAKSLANILSLTRDPGYLPILRRWIKSEDRELRRAALLSLGRYAEPEDIDVLFDHLGKNWSRSSARSALAQYGDRVVPQLLGMIRDPRVDLSIKREIPFILSQIDTSSARGVLVAALYTHDAIVAYRALKSLNNIRDRHDLSYSQESFIPLLQIWAREYYGLLNMDLLFHTRQSPASRLFQKAIKERINWSIEKIFRGLDLFLPHGDAYFSYLGFTSSRQDLRENAIELIDSRIRGELRQTLLPIFSELHPFDVVQKGREIFSLPEDPEKALSEAFFHGDPWLKCCTIVAVCSGRIEGLKVQIMQAREDINPVVRETAEWALREWDGGRRI